MELTALGVTDYTLISPFSKYANEHNQGLPSLHDQVMITSLNVKKRVESVDMWVYIG